MGEFGWSELSLVRELALALNGRTATFFAEASTFAPLRVASEDETQVESRSDYGQQTRVHDVPDSQNRDNRDPADSGSPVVVRRSGNDELYRNCVVR